MKKILFIVFGIGLTANLYAQVPSYVPTNGLVGWWPFNGNANDESGNGNNGTVNGATLTTDRLGNAGKAYSFDGVDDQIFAGNTNLTQNYSISFWAYINSNVFSYPVGFGVNTLSSDGYGIGFSSSAPSAPCTVPINTYFVYDGLSPLGCFNLAFAQNPVNTLSWKNIILTKNNNTVQVYVNGILEISSTALSLQGIINLYFGVRADPLFYFNGKLDDIGLWNRPLTDQEISDLYNSNSCSNDLTINPSTNIQNIGGNAIFTATTSESNPTYTWQSDFGQGFQTLNNYGNYSGANSNIISISNVQLANHNQPLRVIASNGNCVDTSDVAVLNISNTCTSNVTIYDTVTTNVYDTLTTNITVYDTITTNITVYDTLLTTVTDTLIINTTLSLPAPNNENTILIYPNPTSDHITIDNGNFAAMAGYSIKITNNAGQQVFQSAINQQQFYVDLSTWSGNGLYFVHLIDPQNNTVTVRKIVLQ
jgi:hypothetical protein